MAVWRMPIALGLLTGVGLVAGLVADGFWDAVSWAGLGLPLLVVVWYAWMAQRLTSPSKPLLRGRRKRQPQ